MLVSDGMLVSDIAMSLSNILMATGDNTTGME
jgi:hypothetical protein